MTPPHSSQRRELRPKARSSVSEQKGQVRILAPPFELSMTPPFLSLRAHHNHAPEDTIRHHSNGGFITSQFGLGGEDEASEFEVAYLQLVKDALAQGADTGWGDILFL